METAKAVTDGAQWPPTVDPGPALAALIASDRLRRRRGFPARDAVPSHGLQRLEDHSVPDLDDPAKPRRPDWPPVTRPLEFRLLSLPGVDPLARDFF
ncbi:hypothetical protein ACFYZH_15545 [Streptomyces abikoensis]|uniref:hypothetical protein n=1 Tax=Streptomyces abikoensis TaxID=97398 RepID=UPI0036AEFB8C